MTQSEIDLIVLTEIAEEISEHGVTSLTRSSRSYVRTKRAKFVAEVLEKKSHEWMHSDLKKSLRIEELEREVNGLRDEMQVLTDAMLQKF